MSFSWERGRLARTGGGTEARAPCGLQRFGEVRCSRGASAPRGTWPGVRSSHERSWRTRHAAGMKEQAGQGVFVGAPQGAMSWWPHGR